MEEKRDARGLTEREAIKRYKGKNYPKPALTADVVLFAKSEKKLQILLIERGGHPFLGRQALPGGFANENEPIEETARRELCEETGVNIAGLKLVGVYSRPGRDPRGWVVSAAFAAMVETDRPPLNAGDDAAEAEWYTLQKTDAGLVFRAGEKIVTEGQLAFDHAEIIKDALETENL